MPTNLTTNNLSVDGMIGTRTWDGMMVVDDESPELSISVMKRFYGGKVRLEFFTHIE